MESKIIKTGYIKHGDYISGFNQAQDIGKFYQLTSQGNYRVESNEQFEARKAGVIPSYIINNEQVLELQKQINTLKEKQLKILQSICTPYQN